MSSGTEKSILSGTEAIFDRLECLVDDEFFLGMSSGSEESILSGSEESILSGLEEIFDSLESSVHDEHPLGRSSGMEESSYIFGYFGYSDHDHNLQDNISILVSLLDNCERYYKGIKNGSVLEDHVRSLKIGLQFLGKLYFLTTDKNLINSVNFFTADMKHTLTTYEEENGVLNIMKLDHAYQELRGMMRSVVIDPANYLHRRLASTNSDMDDFDIDRLLFGGRPMYNYTRAIDLLLENSYEVLRTWYGNDNFTADGQIAALVKKVEELRIDLTYYKPLCRCLKFESKMNEDLNLSPLESVISEAVVAIYLLLVDKWDENNVAVSLRKIKSCLKRYRDLNIYVRFLKFNRSTFSWGRKVNEVKKQFHILTNLIHILATNSDYLNDANNHLYAELRELQDFVADQRVSGRVNHYLGLTASTEAICYRALPIVYSCYMKEVDLEEGMGRQLSEILVAVVGQIKIIKRRYGSQEIKLYDYPGVDGLGFLEFFLGCLKEKHEQISVMRRDIEALHKDIYCVVSSQKTLQDKDTSEGLWTHIVRLAYQAEYVMDFYLVIQDLGCVSTLSNIVKEVKEIKEKLLALPDKSLHVEDAVVTTSSDVHGKPLQVNNEFLGFQEEIDAIMNHLLGGENDLQVVSVVGMAGAGKTSLARHLFKESSVVGHFDKRAWCTVSQSYQKKDLLLTILKKINPSESYISKVDDEELAEEICRSLKKRRYLVVMDDVWDVALWNYLIRYFPNDKTQSRILITTRDHNVASITKSEILELRVLTDNESWTLLQKKMPQQETLPENLVSIAKEIAKSCKGLPLSIVIISGIMYNAERNEATWNQIAKDVTSAILSDPQGECQDILELSYNHLPSQLKSCFLYLGVFPEDHEISVTRLVRLWVAEGLVQGGIMSENCLEDVGKRYVDDLVTRSLVIPIKQNIEGKVKIFQLHDLLRDFCLKKAKVENYVTVFDDRGTFDLSICPRRISINLGMDNHLPFISLNGVRTMISFCRSNVIEVGIEHIMESEHMMLFNVLDIHELKHPSSYVHRLVHLRYLAIWRIDVSDKDLVLSSISKLRNLQILILSFYVNREWQVPDFIWDLVKLRHIHILPSVLFPLLDSKRLEESHVLLENLKSLSKPRLYYSDSKWLSKLPELQKLSCILFHYWDNSWQQYRFPVLDLCDRLTSLKVENGAEKSQRERCKLHLPASLRKLSLSKFVLYSDDISKIGKSLPNLEVLKLHDSIKIWSVNDEDFPKLKVLKITSRDFHEWDASEDSFPSLQQVWLESCDSLKTLPPRFEDIPCLRLISIKDCNPSVYESAIAIEEIQAEAQNLELKVIYSRKPEPSERRQQKDFWKDDDIQKDHVLRTAPFGWMLR